ncbi:MULTISPECIES: hypothetical protein [unclassified Microcoleus]|uniref:hypothetical protein n=1 Tax=unclassified Microcoleus TaxID=2642155 RepID=UPI002FD562D5
MTPGLHVLKLKPVTGCLRTLPVLLPQLNINRRSSQTRRKFCTVDRVSLSFPAAVTRRRDESKHKLGCSKTRSMTASALLLDLLNTSIAPVRASTSSRLF